MPLLNEDNDIQIWHKQGVLDIATHLIVMFDCDEPFQPYYVYPGECWQCKQGQLEGGGHCWRVFDLMFPLTEKELTDFSYAIRNNECNH